MILETILAVIGVTASATISAIGWYGLISCLIDPSSPPLGGNTYCGTPPDDLEICSYGNVSGTIPTLGVATADVKNGNTDHRILARIFYGDDDASGQWSDWHNINNLGCDDRERGQIDFYDDFSSIYERWLAVALYNCGTDGLALDAIFYWNGTNFKENLIDKFCGNVAGPMVDCYGGAYDPAETGAYCFEEDQTAKYYDYVWIDQNNAACPGVLIGTDKPLKGNSSEPVGRIYPKADPGVPDCDLYTTTNSHMYPNFVRDPQRVNEPDDVYYKPGEMVTMTSTAMYVLVAVLAISMCITVMNMVTICRRNKRETKVKYAKVAYVDESSA